ncbi:biopolymer transporter ExbD [Bacterioplanoides sp. SCSIO 12839]|uniref:ExbD/TolR family protein n=1 Tax=Bacterioplanoides sp. SCSIO 12839 TaxID=2829569 RepID=UPI0021034DF7|nr:biopolymer transporter ExbD [Bacterioplanoides sp. SCSIO 12839]UTW48448.1 biopolymer transporter ExbD [Bacterioplanoides sp. SCSIO 12839]
MSFKIKRSNTDAADIDVTSFMNLMIVLVPVLLMSMTFTKITVMEINLPELNGGPGTTSLDQSQLEIQVRENGMGVYFPAGTLIKDIPKNEQSQYDFQTLSLVLRELKKQVSDKRDALIMLGKELEYQTLINTMDTVKSYQTVIAADLVDVELFPEISLGDLSAKQKGK